MGSSAQNGSICESINGQKEKVVVIELAVVADA
jgi:hypothetical protein